MLFAKLESKYLPLVFSIFGTSLVSGRPRRPGSRAVIDFDPSKHLGWSFFIV